MAIMQDLVVSYSFMHVHVPYTMINSILVDVTQWSWLTFQYIKMHLYPVKLSNLKCLWKSNSLKYKECISIISNTTKKKFKLPDVC